MIFVETPPNRSHRLNDQAKRVALLAFRCARHDDAKKDMACEMALKAYLEIIPNDPYAADHVIDAIADAVNRHPHWIA